MDKTLMGIAIVIALLVLVIYIVYKRNKANSANRVTVNPNPQSPNTPTPQKSWPWEKIGWWGGGVVAGVVALWFIGWVFVPWLRQPSAEVATVGNVLGRETEIKPFVYPEVPVGATEVLVKVGHELSEQIKALANHRVRMDPDRELIDPYVMWIDGKEYVVLPGDKSWVAPPENPIRPGAEVRLRTAGEPFIMIVSYWPRK